MDDSTVVRAILEKKIAHLRAILGRYAKVAVAFSGGVDSTVLLDNCCRVFRPEQIVALHARSCLQSARTVRSVNGIKTEHFTGLCSHLTLDCDPLQWPEFVSNTAERCYYCKKRTYGLFRTTASQRGCEVLLDGTNADDLTTYRPGLRVLREYGVVAPLAEAAMSKADVREYARDQGLSNHDRPSDSCLATRIAPLEPITAEGMKAVEDAEEYLYLLGFAGVRVRPKKSHVCIEVQKKDLTRIVEAGVGELVVEFFRREGCGPVFLDLKGR